MIATADLVLLCHDCRREHRATGSALATTTRAAQWFVRHAGHRTEAISPKRRVGLVDKAVKRLWRALGGEPWWVAYNPNADVKLAYAADSQMTITLASLASSSTRLAGREATSIDNSANLYLDYLISGKVTTGTSPTDNKLIEVWSVAPINDTPTWPDVFDGTDSAETVTSAEIKSSALRELAVIGTNNTSDRTYPFAQTSLAARYGGVCPMDFTVFVTHDTAVNLNSTGSNHEVSAQGIYATVT